MITLDSISKKISSRLLFDDVSISFNDYHRYGLTGPNGAGKSTLLRIMMGLEEPTSGFAILPDKVGFLKQNIDDFQDYKVIDTVIMGNTRLWQALEEREILYAKEMTDEVGMRLGELEEIIAEEDGYSAEAEAEILLKGMGIEEEMYHLQMKAIPIDRRFRVLLCQALFGKPQALLLDEPTNHLDMESISWLEDFLYKYTGTLIVISHDRHFLNTITTDIADIDYDTIILYPGNYDDMVISKTTLRQSAELENKSKEKKVAQLREFVAKFGAGTRASQVKSRIKEIEKIQPSDLKKSNIQRPYIRFLQTEAKQPGKMIFKVENISKSYDDNIVINDLSFDIMRGDKIAIIGNNGLGKTTLLKLLAGVIKPDSGEIKLGHQIDIGYFPQNHHDVIDKCPNTTLFDWLKEKKEGVYDQEIRSVLGKMLFSGDDAFKKLGVLSGGETARLILAGLMLTSPNVLLLDEPNNHLDLESVSALSWGLKDYKGTLLFSSHDRDLVSSVATKLLVFEKDRNISFFLGTLDEYFHKKALV